MLKSVASIVLAAAVWGAALLLPDATAQAQNAVATARPNTPSQIDPAVQKARRARKPAPAPIVAAAEVPRPRCFLFWCESDRPFWLIVGVGY